MEAKRLIGLTGGIGCGKSTVANIFRDNGVHVIDADKVSHVITRPGSQISFAIKEKFPETVVDGRVHRRKLGKIVFSDSAARKWMMDLMWPHLEDAVACIQAHLHDSLVLYDSPLFFETGMDAKMPAIVVHVTPEIQMARIKTRDPDLSDEDITARINVQIPLSVKMNAATWLVDNSGDIESTTQQVNKILNDLGHVRKEFARGIG